MARFQGYDVFDGARSSCGGAFIVNNRVTVRSPLTRDAEAHFYCARGKDACKFEGNAFWADRGPGIHSGA